jgi:release factor glutamine methyltransferase
MNGQLSGNRLIDISKWADTKLSHWEDREKKSTIKWMLQSLLGVASTDVLIYPNRTFSESEILSVHFAMKRLLNNEPIQYVLNESFFGGRLFQLNSSVLIPRPETEEWVQDIRPLITKQDVVLDLGTGSGCIAITMALDTEASVIAMDLSEKALVVAQDNAKRLGANVSFVQQDMRSAKDWIEKATVVISNPPYVLESDKEEMQQQVLDFEPHMALFVPNEDPLLFYQSIVHQVRDFGSNCRMVVLETHEQYAHQVSDLFDQEIWDGEVKKDLQKKDRVVIATKK